MPRITAINGIMTNVSADTAYDRLRTIMGSIAKFLAIETDSIWTRLGDVTRPITFLACRNLLRVPDSE